jgi:hypothetical protein
MDYDGGSSSTASERHFQSVYCLVSVTAEQERIPALL